MKRCATVHADGHRCQLTARHASRHVAQVGEDMLAWWPDRSDVRRSMQWADGTPLHLRWAAGCPAQEAATLFGAPA